MELFENEWQLEKLQFDEKLVKTNEEYKRVK